MHGPVFATLARAAALLGASAIGGTALAADPAPVAFGFPVHNRALQEQEAPAVALDAVGDFVIVWDSGNSAGCDSDASPIQGQRYDASGCNR